MKSHSTTKMAIGITLLLASTSVPVSKHLQPVETDVGPKHDISQDMVRTFSQSISDQSESTRLLHGDARALVAILSDSSRAPVGTVPSPGGLNTPRGENRNVRH